MTARRSWRAGTGTRSSSSANGRSCCSRRRAAGRWPGSGLRRCASVMASTGAGAGLHCAARRPVGQDPGGSRSRGEDGRLAARPVRHPRSGAQAGPLRRRSGRAAAFRHIATIDHEAPLPPLATSRRRGNGRPRSPANGGWASRRPAGGAVELLTNPVLAHLHPTGDHPERPDRLLVLTGETVEREASHEQLRGFTRRLPRRAPGGRPTGPARRRHRLLEDVLAGGDARGGDRARGGRSRRLRADPAAGHHALAARAMGFCLLNNVAVAARYAQAESGSSGRDHRLDVHHGNGTEAMFRGDERSSSSRSTSGRSSRERAAPTRATNRR